MSVLPKLTNNKIIVAGAHAKIIQSVLDFDYARGAMTPNITAIVGGNRKTHKCWFGEKELLLPTYPTIAAAAEAGIEADWLEAIAFAWLAQQTLQGHCANLPEATGARHPCILGAIYQA